MSALPISISPSGASPLIHFRSKARVYLFAKAPYSSSPLLFTSNNRGLKTNNGPRNNRRTSATCAATRNLYSSKDLPPKRISSAIAEAITDDTARITMPYFAEPALKTPNLPRGQDESAWVEDSSWREVRAVESK